MATLLSLIIIVVLLVLTQPQNILGSPEKTLPNETSFDKSFKFGVATSSYQIEGAWNVSDKGIGRWDYLTHDFFKGFIFDGSNGDVACDSYHKYEEDIEMIKYLKVDQYRFSISWSRILPTGQLNVISKTGVEYYNRLINGLLENDIQPVVTIYHFDHPRPFDHLGEWYQPKMVYYFAQYADLLFRLYGDRVTIWVTINEPNVYCWSLLDYVQFFDEGIPVGTAEYMCGHQMLRAHAAVWDLYQKKYAGTQKGRLGMSLNILWNEPASNSSEDIRTSERFHQFTIGWFFNPLVYGDYPQVMIDSIAESSAKQGFPESRLPTLTSEEKKQLKGSFDYLGINYYYTMPVWFSNHEPGPSVLNDMKGEIGSMKDVDFSKGDSKEYARGFGDCLRWIKETYNSPEIHITENGVYDFGGVHDAHRINYHKDILKQLLSSIHNDGVNVAAYYIWSLMDNFEFTLGYKIKYGLFHVDFNDPNRTRTAKDSAHFVRKLMKSRTLESLI